MSDDIERLPQAERARVRARDRKIAGPRVVVDNSGLRKVAMKIGERLRERGVRPPIVKRKGDPPGRPG